MRRHAGCAVLLLMALAVSLAGCQNATAVGAVNDCGTQLDVRASEGSTTTDEMAWKTLSPGNRDEIVDVIENAQTLYVQVRANDGGAVRRFEVPMDQLGPPPTGTDVDKELVLGGDRCP